MWREVTGCYCRGGGKYAGPRGLERLYQKVAEANNGPSRDFYLDKVLAHPHYG